MHRRPKLLLLASASYLILGLAIPAQVIYLQGISAFDVKIIFAQLTSLNMAIMILALTTSMLLFRASRLVYVLLPMLAAIVGYNNYLVGAYEYQYSSMQAMIGAVAFALLSTAIFVIPSIRVPILDKSKRWWNTPSRMVSEFEASLHPFVGPSMLGSTFDLSETGFFIPMQSLKPKGGASRAKAYGLNEFRIGDRTGVLIRVSPGIAVKCEARVIRKSDGEGKYPSGLGFRFEKIDGLHRKMIRNMIRESETA